MKFKPLFFAALLLVFSSLACRFAEQILYDPTATPVPTVTPVPTATPIPPTATPTATPQPTFNDTCPDGNCIEACLANVGALSKIAPSEEHGGFNNSEYDLVTYTISGDEILNPVKQPVSSALKPYQQDEASQRRVWDYFANVIPPEYRPLLTQYIIFSDGEANILASVAQSDNDPNLWVLRVDIVDAADPKELTYTLVHEYAHLLTLNPKQVPPSMPIFNHPENGSVYEQEAAKCDTYFPGEGCSDPDSYINQFVNTYWNDIYDEWAQLDSVGDEQDYYDALDAFYKKYQDQFVSDYAPTDPAEDIAESFSFFVLSPRPAGNTIAEKKLLFFYQYPELADLRLKAIEGICSYGGK
ncbi:MAG: hypothetical protein CO094_01130 [Anaerolineae bacterium CG_4_9_14_3_um_filter_57_17]|nr:hypothetical protein [bacterium]NCT20600.1 hypothetical protein [bacterium]OIO85647.1 MAG: hypothetical protein AUK01_05350 [Anaerolineae bacterium CG2_30_57_67]PJB68467.1 MAG: hypothetical protein CO094_01130 [Anaerolineae bacterium CG_4_9_14_3_um_filter_57_17]